MRDRLTRVLEAIDAANRLDPTTEKDSEGEVWPAALLYGRRMSHEMERIRPDASEVLKIAARGQHIERWRMPRTSYPEGRAGYLAWRKAQGAYHGERVGALMLEAGCSEAEAARVGALLRKENLKTDPETQALEDVICMVFLRWHFADFATDRDAEHVRRIVAKTARKMSAEGRARALEEFDLPPELAAAVTGG